MKAFALALCVSLCTVQVYCSAVPPIPTTPLSNLQNAGLGPFGANTGIGVLGANAGANIGNGLAAQAGTQGQQASNLNISPNVLSNESEVLSLLSQLNAANIQTVIKQILSPPLDSLKALLTTIQNSPELQSRISNYALSQPQVVQSLIQSNSQLLNQIKPLIESDAQLKGLLSNVASLLPLNQIKAALGTVGGLVGSGVGASKNVLGGVTSNLGSGLTQLGGLSGGGLGTGFNPLLRDVLSGSGIGLSPFGGVSNGLRNLGGSLIQPTLNTQVMPGVSGSNPLPQSNQAFLNILSAAERNQMIQQLLQSLGPIIQAQLPASTNQPTSVTGTQTAPVPVPVPVR